MSKRLFNFCAGPAALPEAVLQRAQAELLDWQGKGLSIMEMSHRSDEFVSVAQQAEQDLRDLMSIPDNYKVLFLQSGASQQFAQVPGCGIDAFDLALFVEEVEGVWKALQNRPALATQLQDFFKRFLSGALPGMTGVDAAADQGGKEREDRDVTGDFPMAVIRVESIRVHFTEQ